MQFYFKKHIYSIIFLGIIAVFFAALCATKIDIHAAENKNNTHNEAKATANEASTAKVKSSSTTLPTPESTTPHSENNAESGTVDSNITQTESNNIAPELKVRAELRLVQWSKLDSGLDFLKLGLSRTDKNTILVSAPTNPSDLVILRIDPEFYEFTLHMASEEGQHRSLSEHAHRHALTAAINAGMYLPDKLTNTGYMQSATHTNNPRIASRFGIFFVAEPDNKGLPQATLIEKSNLGENLENFLSHYKIAVQNFRLISSDSEVLWPDSPNIHSISALAQDSDGNLLFILCRFQLSPADLARLLLALPLNCSTAMYLEGGSESGLLLRVPNEDKELIWRGKHNSILPIDGAPEATLPNVLGVRPRPEEKDKSAD